MWLAGLDEENEKRTTFQSGFTQTHLSLLIRLHKSRQNKQLYMAINRSLYLFNQIQVLQMNC